MPFVSFAIILSVKGTSLRIADSKKRAKFCEDYTGYPELCSGKNKMTK